MLDMYKRVVHLTARPFFVSWFCLFGVLLQSVQRAFAVQIASSLTGLDTCGLHSKLILVQRHVCLVQHLLFLVLQQMHMIITQEATLSMPSLTKYSIPLVFNTLLGIVLPGTM